MSLTIQEQVLATIKKHQRFLILIRKDYTGDMLASAIALYHILKKIRKDADILCENFEMPEKFKFLAEDELISSHTTPLKKFIISVDLSKTKLDQFNYEILEDKLQIYLSPKSGNFHSSDINTSSTDFKYDVIFTIGTPDLEHLGEIFDTNTEFFYSTPIINIDNAAENEHFGQINLVQLTSTANAEILYQLFKKHKTETIDENIATMLLTGIISATRSFRNYAVTPQTLASVSELIALGARREQIIANLYRTKSLETLKLWGKVLNNLEHDEQRNLVWSHIKHQDCQKSNEENTEIEDIIEELIINAPEAKVILLFCEESPGLFKIHMYTDKNMDATKLSAPFQGIGGSSNTTFYYKAENITEAKNKILMNIKEQLDELRQTIANSSPVQEILK